MTGWKKFRVQTAQRKHYSDEWLENPRIATSLAGIKKLLSKHETTGNFVEIPYFQ